MLNRYAITDCCKVTRFIQNVYSMDIWNDVGRYDTIGYKSGNNKKNKPFRLSGREGTRCIYEPNRGKHLQQIPPPPPSYRSLLFLYCRQLEQEPARGITRAEIIATSSHSSARPDEITRSLETWTVNAAINYRARGDRASMCTLPPPFSPCPPPLPSPLS